MKTRTIKEIENTERDVIGNGFRSIRVLLEKDNMGFSLHKTIIPRGGYYHWHYKHHLEACYCIQGVGFIKNKETGEKHLIEKDTTYILDNHDDHEFIAVSDEDVILISVFNPPVTGDEIHLKDGSYSIDFDNKNISKKIVDAINSTKNDYDAIEAVQDILFRHNLYKDIEEGNM